MKPLLIASLVLALLVPACAFAQDAFTGTWKMDTGTMHQSGKPLIVHLKDGVYRCNCTPPIEVKADGMDHAVKGQSSFNSVAIKVLNDHSIQETDKQDGKVTHQGTFTASADGKTATNEFKNYRDGTETLGGTVLLNRQAAGASGSNAVAGTWHFARVASASGALPTDMYKVSGNDISYDSGKAGAYTAKIDGKAVPFTVNDKQDGTVAVKRVGKDTLRETYAKDGKTTLTSTMTVAADGKTMKTVNKNFKTGNTMTWTADKQ